MTDYKVNWRAVETIAGLNIVGPLTVTGALTLTGAIGLTGVLTQSDETDASAVGTGSIHTAGGLAVAKKLYVGTDLVIVAGDIDLSSATSGTYDIILKDSVADALSIRRATTDMIVFNTSTPLITITPALTVTGALTANGGIVVGAATTGISITGAVTTGLSLTSAVTASAITGISVAPVVTGQCSGTITGISVDYDYSGGDINAYGIDVDIQQTGETSGTPAIGSRGNIQVIRGDARVAYTLDDAYAVRGSCYIMPSATEEVNDCVGVFATIQHTGTIERGATTSSFCAMKADISNGSTGSWEGNMFNLMCGYGSSVNYGGTSAIIYGYTHGDARADYGLYINNYSPNMLAGIRLGETAGATPIMESALWLSSVWGDAYNTGAILIAGDQAGTALAYGAGTTGVCVERVNVTAAMTGGSYFFGKYATYATSGAMADGFIMGNYTKVSLGHLAYENYAVRGRMCVNVAQTGDTGNQYIGMFGAVEMCDGAHALLATGGAYGVLGTALLAGGSLDQPLIAGYFDCNAVVDVAGGAYAIRARMQGYVDAGINIFTQTAQANSMLKLSAEQSGTTTNLIEVDMATGSGSASYLLKLDDSTSCCVNTSGALNAGDTNADAIIKIQIGSTDYYLGAWVAGSVSGEW